MELKSMFIIDVLLYITGIFLCVSLIFVMVLMVDALIDILTGGSNGDK